MSNLTIEGSFSDSEKIRELSSICDVVTTEIEHVDAATLATLEDDGVVVRPSAKTLRCIQDKLLQKTHLRNHTITQPEFAETATLNAAIDAAAQFGYPFMLKCRKLAYDGRGNALVRSEDELISAFEALNGGRDLYAEAMVPFVKELAVMVVRTSSDILAYPVVETIQADSVCRLVIAPAEVPRSVVENAQAVAREAVATFDGIGIYGVEMFLLADDTILINEVAPRCVSSVEYFTVFTVTTYFLCPGPTTPATTRSRRATWTSSKCTSAPCWTCPARCPA